MARSRPHDIQGTVRGLGQVANWLPGLTNIGDAETIHSALNWLRHAGFEKDIKNAHFPKDPRKLNGEAHRPVGVLDEEVLRAAARCGASQSELGRFALLRQRVDGHLLHGDWEAALRVLAGIEDELGQSLWLIRTSVATLTQMPGSAVGSYCSGLLAAVRNRGRVALVAGYTRPLGQRSLNPFDHAERIILRMAERNVPAGVRSYLGWVVTGQLHTEASVQADLLAHTSRGAVIDTFEALVAVIHSRFRCRQDSGAELYHAATALCRVDDPRLLPPLAMQKGVLQHATSSPYDAIARGAPAAAPGAATDYWSQIDLPARSWACQGSDAGAEEASWSPSRVLRRGLLAALNGEPEAESFTQAYRVALLFGSSVWARDYVCAIEEESLALGLVDRPPVHALCTLGSKPVAVVPPPYLRLHPSPMCATAAGSPAAACSAVAAGTASDDVLRAHADVSGEERALALALGALRREEWTAAFADSTALVQSSKRFYRRRGLQIRAQALVRSGDYGAAARTMCDYLVEQKGVWFDLPVQDVLSAMTGRAHGAAVHARDRAILYSLPPAAAYSELRDEQMNAFDDLLDEYGVDRPSNLPAGVRAEPWCGYFLAHTCSADMIERSLRLPTKRAALEERIKICQLLEASGPEDVAAATRLEAISLTRLLSVTSQAGGLEQVKLTLDVERLKERVRSAVALDYARYVEGVRRGERPMHSDTILGMLEAHTPVAWDKLDLRSDPVWEVFSTLARKANQTYVADPTYGLNAILSMRIRHGAVEGLIHGEFRDFGLLTTRKGDRYCANEEWTGRWASACGLAPDSPLLARFADALSSLTKALDGLVRDLCDSLLRVRGEAHPRGLIEARLSEEFLRGLETEVRPDRDVAMFCDVFFQFMHSALVTSLRRVQPELQALVAKRLTDAFSDALNAVMESARPATFPQLETALISARTHAGTVARRLADWFKEPANLDFEPFDVGECIRLAHHMSSERAPVAARIETHDADGRLLHGVLYVPLVDILLNLFQNVSEHSHCLHPNLTLVAELSDVALTIRASNPMGAAPSCEEVAELTRIRGTIGSARSDALGTTEGGTGLAKIANFLGGHPLLSGSSIAFEHTCGGGEHGFRVDLVCKLLPQLVVPAPTRAEPAPANT